jgi:hypothetical protein
MIDRDKWTDEERKGRGGLNEFTSTRKPVKGESYVDVAFKTNEIKNSNGKSYDSQLWPERRVMKFLSLVFLSSLRKKNTISFQSTSCDKVM